MHRYHVVVDGESVMDCLMIGYPSCVGKFSTLFRMSTTVWHFWEVVQGFEHGFVHDPWTDAHLSFFLVLLYFSLSICLHSVLHP